MDKPSMKASILDSTTNVAVVQLPGRAFPGSVVQGDSLFILLHSAEEISRMASPHNDPELEGCLDELIENLYWRFRHYADVVVQNGGEIPDQWMEYAGAIEKRLAATEP